MLTYSWLHYKRYEVKRSVKWQLIRSSDLSELELIKVSKEEADSKLKWEHSKEFEYQGEMYDIVRVEDQGDSISYWCWWDHEETRLNKQLKLLLARAYNQDPIQNEGQFQIFLFFKSLHHQEIEIWNPTEHFTYIEHSSGYLAHFNSYFPSIPTPPPHLV